MCNRERGMNKQLITYLFVHLTSNYKITKFRWPAVDNSFQWKGIPQPGLHHRFPVVGVPYFHTSRNIQNLAPDGFLISFVTRNLIGA
jgi:hypothetical protein